MRVLLTGSTGYIGSAVLAAVRGNGHEVTALVRSEDGAARARAVGARPVLGDMRDHGLIARLAGDAEAVVHTASPGDAILVEPAIVYGHGDGIPNTVTRADATGTPPGVQLVGDGSQHWGTVHVDDLADLFLLALEQAPHGSVYLAASGQNPTVRELAEAASRTRGLDGQVTPESDEATIARLGAFGEALLLDQQASGARARNTLGWSPTRPSLLAEIEDGRCTD